uniref:Uncharacterized protein n=1 Tax=Rhizophora mucronata TaxID=61149 RepID=A0A2P2Q7B7_RHIMU
MTLQIGFFVSSHVSFSFASAYQQSLLSVAVNLFV